MFLSNQQAEAPSIGHNGGPPLVEAPVVLPAFLNTPAKRVSDMKEMKPSPDGTTPWSRKDMPNCSGWKSFIVPGGAFHGAGAALMAEAGFERANTLNEADVVVFLGGSDVNPKLYGQAKLPGTHFDDEQDIIEEWHYNEALKKKIPMFGICRGAQLLHVLNKGKLWQDVNNHAGKPHMMLDIEEDVRVEVTSLHHQMIQMSDDVKERLTIIGVCEEQIATTFEDQDNVINLAGKGPDGFNELEIEAGCYADTRCFFVQGHPEIGSRQFRSWTMYKLHEFLCDWIPFMDDPDMEQIRLEVSKQIG